MNKTFMYTLISLLLAGAFILGACGPAAPQTIKIGVNAEITGDIPKSVKGPQIRGRDVERGCQRRRRPGYRR